jgi:uncharacterized protein (DUF58 family)
MTAKASFVSLLTCGLLLAALIARNGQILVLAVPFLVYLVIGLLQCPGTISLHARRTLAKTEVAAGEPLPVHVKVDNQGEGLVNLCLADAYDASMQVEGQAHRRLALSAGESTELRYAVQASRGLYAWDTVDARASDPFGLFELKQPIPVYSELRVRPAPLKIRSMPFVPRETLHAPGPTVARLAGTGTDFWGVREYRPGDPLRRLNWRLTGRYPRRLFTNQFQAEEIADFGLIVDARALSNDYGAESTLFESSIRAAAALAQVILNKGNRVALLVFGENTSSLYPGYGKRQLNFVMQELCRARLGRNLSFRYLEYFPTRVFPAQSVIMVFSAVDARDLDTYARLRAYGYEVILVSPSPVELAAHGVPGSRLNELALRTARLERAVQLKTLLEMGVQVIDWNIDQPLDPVLRSTALAMAHRRNL